MKIIEIDTQLVDQYMFVQVHTDAGISGLGECGAWGFFEAAKGAVETFKQYLIGQDPLKIEYHWQTMYRATYFRGASIMGALSAIDIALWDIAGKYFNVPCYQLLGGKYRDKVRVYAPAFKHTRKELIQVCTDAKNKGFTAIGHLSPFVDEPQPYFKSNILKIKDAIDIVGECREIVGDNIDLCIEIHRSLTPPEAIELARGIEQFHPLFYEDPIPPDNVDAMTYIASKINIPIATGERFHNIWEFEALLSKNAAQFIRPDVCLCGGLTSSKKIAALAEAHYVGVVPHNPLSPVSTAACVQLAACIPNFVIQEYPREEIETLSQRIVKSTIKLENGFLVIPDIPGIGVELAPDAKERYPFRNRRMPIKLHVDGSRIDI